MDKRSLTAGAATRRRLFDARQAETPAPVDAREVEAAA